MIGILEILCGIIIFLFVFHYYYNSKFDFWKQRGIPGPKAIPFFGTIKDVILGRKTQIEYIREIYNTYKGAPLVGIFKGSQPVLIINDPVLINDVLITNGTVFESRGIPISKKGNPLTGNILRLESEPSRQLRAQLSPMFTPSKVKNTFPVLLQRMEIFEKWIDKLSSQNKQINCSDIIRRLTADFTSVCLFGYDMETMDRCPDMIEYAIQWNRASWRNGMQELLMENAMRIYDLIGYYLFNNAKMLNIVNRFANNIAKYREKHNIVQHDIASVFMELMQNPGKLAGQFELTKELVLANYGILFIASFDTPSITVSNALYEIALNKSIQNKLREEICNVYAKCNGKMTFNDINTMEYLEAVIKETLRKYPVADALKRCSLSTYKFRDLQISIPKGQLVIVPVYALHYDPEIYPNPEVFDPERFLNETATSRHSMYYIPFGHGVKGCIGERFGLLQVKLGMITFLRNYTVEICEETCNTYGYDENRFIQQSRDIYLKLRKIE